MCPSSNKDDHSAILKKSYSLHYWSYHGYLKKLTCESIRGGEELKNDSRCSYLYGCILRKTK